MDKANRWSANLLTLLLLAACGCREKPQPEVQSASTDAPVSQAAEQTRSRSDRIPVSPASHQTRPETVSVVREDFNEEVFNELAGGQWKKLQTLLTSDTPLDAAALHHLTTTDVVCSSIRPDNLDVSFEQPGMRVLRGKNTPPTERQSHGREAFAAALEDALTPWSARKTLHSKFKLFRVIPHSDSIETHQYVSISGPTPNGFQEMNALWIAHWEEGKDGAAPRLRELRVSDYEEIRKENGKLFADSTRAVLGANDCFPSQLLPGNEHWLARHPRFDPNGYQGLAIGDVNNDGRDDLYLCQGYGLPNRLFVQNADGTASDVSDQAKVDWLEMTRSALIVDLDNDGDQDLVVGTQSALLLLENQGELTFTVRLKLTSIDNAFSLSSVDYDHDGDLDLYACRYYADGGQQGAIAQPENYQDSNDGGRNILLRNNGEFRFNDVTTRVGLDVENRRYSFAASWEDYDNDGDQDLYVANDFGRNNLYRNDQGRFVNIAAKLGVEDRSFGMSVAWGDYNRDGWMDLYVSNMFSAAGNRVTYQTRFEKQFTTEKQQQFQYLARGNSLFENTGRGGFRDVSSESATMMGRWSWGACFSDLNNDGWEDLVVTNGYLTRPNSGDL